MKKTIQREAYKKETLYRGDITKKKHQAKGILYKEDIHTKGICIQKRYTQGKNIYIERTYIW